MQKTGHETIAAIVEALESSGAKAVVTSEDPLALFFNTSPDEPVNVIADSDDSEPRVLCGFVGDDGFGGDPGVRCGNESASVEWLLVNTEKFKQHARRHVFEHEIERRDVRPGLPHRSMQLAQLIDRHRVRLVLRFHGNAALLAMLGWRRMAGFAIIKPFAVVP